MKLRITRQRSKRFGYLLQQLVELVACLEATHSISFVNCGLRCGLLNVTNMLHANLLLILTTFNKFYTYRLQY